MLMRPTLRTRSPAPSVTGVTPGPRSRPGAETCLHPAMRARARGRHRARRAGAGRPQPRHAARGAARRRHAGGHALPADPLRRAVRRPGVAHARVRRLRPAARARASTTCGRDRPVTVPVTLECAGNGRAMFETAAGQPAVAARGGRHRRVDRHAARPPAARRPASPDGTVEVAVHGPRPRHRGRARSRPYERSLPLAEAMRDDVLLVYEMNGQPLLPQHGAPLRLRRARLVRHDAREVARRASPRSTEPFEGYQNAVELPHARDRRRGRRSRSPASACGRSWCRRASRASPSANACSRPVPSRSRDGRGRARAPIERVEVSVDGCATWADAALEPSPAPSRLAPLDLRLDRDPGRARARVPRHRRDGRDPAHAARAEPGRLREQRRAPSPGHGDGRLRVPLSAS